MKARTWSTVFAAAMPAMIVLGLLQLMSAPAFAQVVAPTVTTNVAADVTDTSATGNLTITANGGEDPSEIGFDMPCRKGYLLRGPFLRPAHTPLTATRFP